VRFAAVPNRFVIFRARPVNGLLGRYDASVYYLEQYGLSPDPELVEHIRRLWFVKPEVDGAAIHRALAVLEEPPANEPTWTYDG
jgi:hypothetical protein